jgi:2,4-dienoyl-CoA reductase-like NADH-dependent reductase (Old Yellow Enzyme family)
MAKLFEAIRFREINLKNRIVVSPMCEYSSIDGFANDWHMVHLGSRSVGGASLIIFEATAVSSEGRITPGDLGIWKDDHIEFLKRINSFIASQNALSGIQLAHAGRKASHKVPWEGGHALTETEGSWQTVAPSPVPFKEGEPIPKELAKEDIQKIKNDFRNAAIRAITAGFKVIEIHAAHGYLLHEFLSPLSNQRIDEYGGSFRNRIRLLMEITDAIRDVWPENYPLFVRISATDWMEGGWNIEESVELAKLLKEHGIDLIDCSTGGNVAKANIPVGPMYQVPFSERIRKEAGIKTAAVGMITTAQQAEMIIEKDQADIIVLARQLLRDPYFPLHAAKELGVNIDWPVQYQRARN